jgi:transcriptional regulator with XRE-family HTH domain
MNMATKDTGTARRIGERIRDERKKRQWSQALLAEKIGKLQSQVSEWENGECQPQLDTLMVISRVMKIEIGKLLAV